MRREQSLRFGPRQPRSLVLPPIQTGADQLAGRRWIEILVLGRLSDRPREPVAALRRAREDVRAGLREAEVRHPRAPTNRQRALGGYDARHDRRALPSGCHRDRLENPLGIATQRIHIERHQRVHARISQDPADAPQVIPGTRAKRHHKRVPGLSSRLRDDQAARRASIGRERRHPDRVGDDPDLAPGRQRLAVEELGGVEQLLPTSEPLNAAIMQQSVNDRVPVQRGARVRACLAPRRIRPTMSLDGENRLASRDPPRDPRKPLRVADRLYVQHHHGSTLVLLPQLEQVVGRDVRTMAKRSEARNPEPSSRRMPEQSDPDRSRLRADRQAPREHAETDEGRVQAHLRVGVQHPQAVRSDQPHPRAADNLEQPLLPLAGLIALRRRISPASTTSAFDPFSAASRATSTTCRRGQRSRRARGPPEAQRCYARRG